MGRRAAQDQVSPPGPIPTAARGYSPVRTPAWLSSCGRLCTSSKELKWWASWCRPYIPF